MTAPISRNNPTRLYKGSQAQINTGEYRPYGMGKKGNVYIQNNYYGPQHPRGWAYDAWANMDHYCGNSGDSTMGKIFGGIATGMSVAGSFLDLLGVGKKGSVEGDPGKSAKGKAAEEPTKTTNNDKTQGNQEPAKTTDNDKAQGQEPAKTTNNDKAQGQEPAKTTNNDKAQGQEPAKTTDDNNTQTRTADEERPGGNDDGENDPGNAQSWDNHDVRIYDTSKRTKDIEGKLKVTKEAKANSKFPEEFQTTTAAGYTYKYENTGRTDANNQPIYKCVSETVNGKTRSISSGNEYACQLDANGNPKFQFEQNEQIGKDGYGKGV